MTGRKRPVYTESYAQARNPGRKGKIEAGSENIRRTASGGSSGRNEKAGTYRQPKDSGHTDTDEKTRRGSMKLRRKSGQSAAEPYKKSGQSAAEPYKKSGQSAAEPYRKSRRSAEEVRRKSGKDSGELYRSRSDPGPGRRSGNGKETAEQRIRSTPDSDAAHRKRKSPEKKKKQKKSAWWYVKGILCVTLGIAILGGIGIFLFETQEIVVSGIRYCSEQEIVEWVKQDPYAKNSLYIFWKYNRKELKLPPAVEQVEVVLKSPQKVEVKVTEKVFTGRIDYQEQFLYFDQDGIVALVMPDVIEGVPYIEGLEIDMENIQIGKKLPVTDQEIFSEIGTLTELLEKKDLRPDKVSCAGADLTLHFGGIRVQVGSGGFSEKLVQIPPILEKMNGLYAGQTGVLHLENYSISDGSIRFVPDTAAEG